MIYCVTLNTQSFLDILVAHSQNGGEMRDLRHILSNSNFCLFKKSPEKLKETDRIAYDNLFRYHYLYLKIKDKEKAEAANIIALWLSKTVNTEDIEFKNMYHELTQAIKSAKRLVMSIVREFMPGSYRFSVSSDGVVRNTNDPIELIRLLFQEKGDPGYAEMRSFEALVNITLGVRYLLTDIENSKREGRLSNYSIWLEKHLFHRTERSKQELLSIVYDPNNKNRFVKFGQGQNSIEFEAWYRYIKIKDTLIKVMYNGRTKQTEDIFRKVVLTSEGGTRIVDDAQGITLVFMNEDDFEITHDYLMREIFPNAAAISDIQMPDNSSQGNGFSAKISTPQRQFIAHTFAGTMEVQLILYRDYFNRKLSLGEENHLLYRLRQILPLLELLFPTELHKVDWKNKDLIKKMEQLQINRLLVDFM